MPPWSSPSSSKALVLGAVVSAAAIFFPTAAEAIMKGRAAGAIGRHVVKLVGPNTLCTATVIGRQKALTANHCFDGAGPFFVEAGGKRIAISDRTRSGQVTMLTLAEPLPADKIPIATDSSSADGPVTIAGFGTAVEKESGMLSAGLREATLVPEPKYNGFVDPKRKEAISASACMGDSGGPVAKWLNGRYILVGIIERVSNIGMACGYITHASQFGNLPSDAPLTASVNVRQTGAPNRPPLHATHRRGASITLAR